MNFELLSLSRLMYDEKYMKKCLPYLKPEYFHDASERKVFEFISEFVNKYYVAPTKEALAIVLNEAAMPENLFDGAANIINLMSPDESNFEWMCDQTEKWAQDKAIYNAVMQAIGIIEGQDKTLDKNAIPEILSQALAVSFTSDVGHSYFEDAEAQYDFMHDEANKHPFSIDVLNRLTKGGVKDKTLNICFAGINVGKTTFLVQQAAHWLARGKNVLYITLEVAEEEIRNRVDVSLMELNFDQLFALQKTQYMNRVNSLRQMTQGELFVKQFAPGSAHVGHFRHAIKELLIKKGVRPDVIMIDYIGICASSRLPASAKSNTNTYFTSVAEELRGLGVENICPIWTGAQFDRSGQTGDDVDMTNTGLAIGIQATSDFSIAFMMPDEMAAMNQAIGKVLKNRYANKAHFKKFVIGLDNDLQRYFDLDASEQSKLMDPEEQEAYNKASPIPTVPVAVNTNKLSSWSF